MKHKQWLRNYFKNFILFLILISSSIAIAEDADEECYVDKTYNLISETVIDSSNYIDNSINDMLEDSDNNSTLTKINTMPLKKKQFIDSFFRNKKFTDETDETYISVKLNSIFDSLYTNKFSIGVTARIPLSKSTKKYNLFINGLKKEDTNTLIANQVNEQSGTEIGINYFAPLFHQIKSRYSLGVNGINLFTIARYSIEKDFYSWKVQVAETFKYSLKDLFEEETNIYLDKQLSIFRLFRITLNRGTQEKKSGMDYSLIFEHYWIFNETAVLNLSQLFSGNTKYEYNTKRDGGVTHYTTALSFRKSTLRKWFFYGITPSINFDKQYEYRANYKLNFYLEFYFGYLK